MADEIKSNSNLEPFEKDDLDLKKKFVGDVEIDQKNAEKNPEKKNKTIQVIEGMPGKKENNAENEAAYSKILSKAAMTSQQQALPTDENVKNDAQAVNIGTDAESKISNLVNLAQTKSIPYAVKVARHMEDNFVLDEFHDRMLGEELHDALVKKGMIKEF